MTYEQVKMAAFADELTKLAISVDGVRAAAAKAAKAAKAAPGTSPWWRTAKRSKALVGETTGVAGSYAQPTTYLRWPG